MCNAATGMVRIGYHSIADLRGDRCWVVLNTSGRPQFCDGFARSAATVPWNPPVAQTHLSLGTARLWRSFFRRGVRSQRAIPARIAIPQSQSQSQSGQGFVERISRAPRDLSQEGTGLHRSPKAESLEFAKHAVHGRGYLNERPDFSWDDGVWVGFHDEGSLVGVGRAENSRHRYHSVPAKDGAN